MARKQDRLNSEIQFHLEQQTAKNIQAGMTPDEARRAAAVKFGAVDRLREATEDRPAQWRRWWTSIACDLTFAVRRLRRRPKFAAVAVVTMALGIGAATAIFSIVDGVLLRPPPFDEPDRLVSVWLTDDRWRTEPALASGWDRIPVGRAEYDPLREHAPALAESGLWTQGTAMLSRGGGSATDGLERIPVVRVTASVLPLLRVTAARGRTFSNGEDVLNGPKVALLSWETWQSRFGGANDIVGGTIVLDDVTYQVVGILPAGVKLSRSSPPPAVWIPALQQESDLPAKRNRSYRALARLAANATPERAAHEAGLVFRSAADGDVRVGARVETWQQDDTRNVRATLLILMGAVGLLLAIACVNVSMMTLADAGTRRREVTSRVALGADTRRLVRQFLIESLIVAAAGAAVGSLAAMLGIGAILSLAPKGVPGLADVTIDLRALLFASATMIIVGVASGLAPALVTARTRASLADSGSRNTRRGIARLQQGLVATEIALSLMLLVGCGLLGHSLSRLREVNAGFSPAGLVAVDISGTRSFWRSTDRSLQFFSSATDAVSGIAGVEAVAATSVVPFGLGASSSPIFIEGGDARGRSTQQVSVSANYFDVMRVPIVEGQGFGGALKDTDPVVIVSELAARRDFGHASPIGHRVRWQGQWRTIVGVAADIRTGKLSTDMQPTIYAPIAQSGDVNSLIVRSGLQDEALASQVRSRLRDLDAGAAVQSIQRLDTMVARSFAEERFRAMLVTLFGVIAGVLAGVGVFAVTSHAVSMRLREAGIRVALGASVVAVGQAMVRETLGGVCCGLLAGGAGAALLARWLAPQLYGIAPWDGLAFAGAAGLLLATVGVALIPPIRLALAVDPVTVLRAD